MNKHVVWAPQQKQFDFMRRPEDEALYGGAAGGGKSEALVIEALRQIKIPTYKGLILRKTYPELGELIDKSLTYYPKIAKGARYKASDHTWVFPSGAKIIFGHLQHEKDKLKYQGQTYSYIAFDELTHFSFDEYIYLLSRNRPNAPGLRTYMRATANPGGPGHSWVKERFIDPCDPGKTIWDKVEFVDPEGKLITGKRSRVFISSTVFDNKILMKNDPGYAMKLAAMPEAEKKALLYGDWNSYVGQYFSEFKNDHEHYKDRKYTHVIDPFEIPDEWSFYCSLDWGYNRPFSVGYWSYNSKDDILFRIDEVYGCTNNPNEGLQMAPTAVFQKLQEYEANHPFLKGRQLLRVADPAIFSSETGESISDVANKHGFHFNRGDNSRIAGWLQMHDRMTFDENGYCKLYIFKNCKQFIRTIPTLQYDDHKIEDLDTDGEDHIADECRYMLMFRKIRNKEKKKKDPYYNSTAFKFLDIPKENLVDYEDAFSMKVKEIK